jgi:hypothetical protein
VSQPATACLGRGLASLRANWELVPLNVGLALVATILGVAGLVVPVYALGVEVEAGMAADPEAIASWLAETWQRAREVPLALGLALAAALLLATLALLVQCFAQAGALGVLVAADRQAPPAARGRSAWFRTFSGRDFRGWGALLLWRFFGLVSLYLAAFLLLLGGALLAAVAAMAAFARWGGPAAAGIGCGAALPLSFAGLVLALSYGLAAADCAREGSGVLSAARTGLTVLSRRPGATLLLYALFLIVAVVAGLALAPLGFAIDLALGAHRLVAGAARLLLKLLELGTTAVLGTWLRAGLVALVRGEARGGALS